MWYLFATLLGTLAHSCIYAASGWSWLLTGRLLQLKTSALAELNLKKDVGLKQS